MSETRARAIAPDAAHHVRGRDEAGFIGKYNLECISYETDILYKLHNQH